MEGQNDVIPVEISFDEFIAHVQFATEASAHWGEEKCKKLAKSVDASTYPREFSSQIYYPPIGIDPEKDV